jgi:thiol-disulfide isomerase/thioredoxin
MLSESIGSLAPLSIQTITAPDVRPSPRLTTDTDRFAGTPIATSPRRNTVKLVQLITAAALFCATAASHALDVKPHSAAALAEAQKADKPVALHFRADWCPTCRVRDKLLDAMKSEPGLGITVLAVNYDTEGPEEAVRHPQPVHAGGVARAEGNRPQHQRHHGCRPAHCAEDGALSTPAECRLRCRCRSLG